MEEEEEEIVFMRPKLSDEDLAKRDRITKIWRETYGFTDDEVRLVASFTEWKFYTALLDAEPVKKDA